MVAKNKESDDYLVLRFWAANPHIEPGNKQLWLGTVYGVSLFSPFDIVHLPLRQVNYSESVLRFNDSLAQLKSDLLVRKKQYANIGISYSWRGEVLLLEFSGNHQSTAIGQEKTHLVRQQLGASNMTIMSPLTFRKKQLSLNELDSTQYAQQAAYQYESNGVRIFVEHDQYRNKYPSLSDVRTQLRNQLRSRPELELISFDESPIQVGDISGTRFTTQYQMMPFAKQVTYQVQFLMQDKNIWLVTGSYKNCDTRGKQLVNAMLDSISIISHPLN